MAAFWMMMSLLIASSITGVLTAVIFESRAASNIPSTGKDLSGRSVCAGPGYFQDWLSKQASGNKHDGDRFMCYMTDEDGCESGRGGVCVHFTPPPPRNSPLTPHP